VIRIKMGERTYTPPEISAFILRQLKKNAEAALGVAVRKAVITVPAYSTTHSGRRPRMRAHRRAGGAAAGE